MTAYVVAGLTQAKAAGVDVKDEAITKGAAWLERDFTRDPKLMPDLRAYMLYALSAAGHLDSASFTQIYDKRSALSPYGLAILGLALEQAQAKDGRAAEIATLLEAAARQDAEQAWWPATRDQNARLLRGRHRGGHRLRREIPLPPASKQRSAAPRRRCGS